MMKLSKRLLELRGSISQAELARKAGVPQSAISEIEAGKRKPRIDTIQKLALALGVSVSELLDENEEPKAV
ncbi:helix-turn-helix domain protein [Desulfofundulus kuznetsovii DSM 6115]|uniref:Helix-turn-helix domain protein n=1 Tax=Desulfofundulus kuznetsovii (strain DSM 6115 / VKM B-1805 / 17) TaxID=760568 RepID=A0AAU8PPC8_DESK7|nr:helix-turn-helix domain protein [Desulfofundulus kuznetsovii DSM 6115]